MASVYKPKQNVDPETREQRSQAGKLGAKTRAMRKEQQAALDIRLAALQSGPMFTETTGEDFGYFLDLVQKTWEGIIWDREYPPAPGYAEYEREVDYQLPLERRQLFDLYPDAACEFIAEAVRKYFHLTPPMVTFVVELFEKYLKWAKKNPGLKLHGVAEVRQTLTELKSGKDIWKVH